MENEGQDNDSNLGIQNLKKKKKKKKLFKGKTWLPVHFPLHQSLNINTIIPKGIYCVLSTMKDRNDET